MKPNDLRNIRSLEDALEVEDSEPLDQTERETRAGVVAPTRMPRLTEAPTRTKTRRYAAALPRWVVSGK